MKPPLITAHLQIAGTRPRELAEQIGVTESAVNHCIHGRSTSRRIATEISRVTGLSLNALWPGRYDRAARQVRKAA